MDPSMLHSFLVISKRDALCLEIATLPQPKPHVVYLSLTWPVGFMLHGLKAYSLGFGV